MQRFLMDAITSNISMKNKDKCNKKIDVEQTSKDRMVEITLKN